MKKTLISNVVLFLVLLCTGLGVRAQIGMGTPTPRGALDINRPTTNTWGLVLPTNSSTNNIVNPMGGNVAVGTLMYDSTLDCMRLYRSSGWSDCVCICPSSSGTVTSLDCSGGTSTGTLLSGTAASGANGTIPYMGGNGGTYSAFSVASTGVTGLTLSIAAGSFASGLGSLNYTITGTPSGSGTASFPIVIGGQSCILTRTVSSPGIITTLNCSGGSPSGTLVSGIAASGVNGTIAYTGGNGGTYNAFSTSSTGITGLTLNISAGTFASGTGNLNYTITGTPSGSGTASFAITIGGQSCTLTRTVTSPGTITALNCSSSTSSGTLISGTAASGVNGTIPYTGGNGGGYSSISVASTGVTGLTLNITADSFAFGAGSLNYTITGTPSAAGTASFAITIGGQSCTLTRSIQTGAIVTSLDCSNGTLSGSLTAGTAASGVSGTIPYTGGNSGVYNALNVASTGVTGLTLTISGGTLASGAGSLNYTITGTPSTAGTASFAISIGGQNCTLTRTAGCANPNTVPTGYTDSFGLLYKVSEVNWDQLRTGNGGGVTMPSGAFANATPYSIAIRDDDNGIGLPCWGVDTGVSYCMENTPHTVISTSPGLVLPSTAHMSFYGSRSGPQTLPGNSVWHFGPVDIEPANRASQGYFCPAYRGGGGSGAGIERYDMATAVTVTALNSAGKGTSWTIYKVSISGSSDTFFYAVASITEPLVRLDQAVSFSPTTSIGSIGFPLCSQTGDNSMQNPIRLSIQGSAGPLICP